MSVVRNSPQHHGSKWGHLRLAHTAVGGVTSAGAAGPRSGAVANRPSRST